MSKIEEKEIDLLEIPRVLSKRWKAIAVSTLVLFLAGGAVFLALPPKYTAENVFIVTKKEKDNPLEQWGVLAEQFGFSMSKSSDPLLTMLDRVLASPSFYEGFRNLSVNPAHAQDSSLVRLLKIENVPPDEQTKALTGRIVKLMKFETNKDNSYSILIKTRSPSLSVFLANQITGNLNKFFLNRAQTEMNRKISFLSDELRQNQHEVDSLSGLVRGFLETNKDISSPALSFRNRTLNQKLSFSFEKMMLTAKAHQSLKITASQPEYFFESISPAEDASTFGRNQKAKILAVILIAAFLCSSGSVLLFRWFLRISGSGRT